MGRLAVEEFKKKRMRLLTGGRNVDGPFLDRKDTGRRRQMTARERIEYLFDEGTFLELYAYAIHNCHDFGMSSKKVYGDGVITGMGFAGGKKVFAFAQDFTFIGGSVGKCHADKIAHLIEQAANENCPVVGIFDSGGARIQEGVSSLSGFGKMFYQMTKASGKIPQIAAIMGPCAGGAAYGPALMDYVFMVEHTGKMFITGPKVVEVVTGEKVDARQLGGAAVHERISGVAHKICEDDRKCLDDIKRLIEFFPQSGPRIQVLDADLQKRPKNPQNYRCVLDHMIPEVSTRAYDIEGIITLLLDGREFFELQRNYARNIVTGLGRIYGWTVGIVASNPGELAGCLDIRSSEKAARFIRTCDAFHIPVITLVDTPGYLPGSGQEHGGIIRYGSAMLYAYSEADVPKITVVMRKAYGGAYIAMCSKSLGADVVFAWPTAEIAVMGPEAAVDIVFKEELKQAQDAEALRVDKVREYREKFANPYNAAEHGEIDEVIMPNETRERIGKALALLGEKDRMRRGRKHGNIQI